MPHADVVVIGGGLAGVLAAEVLHARGHDVRGVDRPGRRASDAPCAIVHPFVGGTFSPRPHVEEAWLASRTWFLARQRFVRESIVRRHLPDTKPGNRLLESWPKVDALARRLFTHVVPPTSDRFVEYGPVLAVDLQRLLESERRGQRERGIVWYEGAVVELERDGEAWRVHLEGGGCWSTSRVVVAAGVGALPLLRRFADVDDLARAEGTLAWAEGELPGPFLIHGGHASGAPGRFAWGATYRMLEGDPRCPRRALAEIDARLRAVGAPLPRLEDARRWTATRLVDTRSRSAWVREHARGLWSMCAFGSQGCLWGPWSAGRLVG